MSPNDSVDAVRNLLLTTLSSALAPHSAIYAAGPLDTGRTFYSRTAPAGASTSSEIRRRNQDALSKFVQHLRGTQPLPVIDPGLLRVPDWTAKQTGDFFIEVIRRFACQARFIGGWEFSNGATKEFIYCRRSGLPCLDENGEPISDDVARALMRQAIVYAEGHSADASKLKTRLIELDECCRRTNDPAV